MSLTLRNKSNKDQSILGATLKVLGEKSLNYDYGIFKITRRKEFKCFFFFGFFVVILSIGPASASLFHSFTFVFYVLGIVRLASLFKVN